MKNVNWWAVAACLFAVSTILQFIGLWMRYCN